MRDGFVQVCAAAPEVKVADCGFNAAKIIEYIEEAHESGAKLVVFPELCVTGYTCGDLFFQQALLEEAERAVAEIAEGARSWDIISVIGVPAIIEQKIYNCAAVVYRGRVIALIPKTFLPNYNEFYEARYFAEAQPGVREVKIFGQDVPFGTNIIVRDKNIKNFALAAEICEDLWTVSPPSCRHAASGATVIANLSAGNEIIGKSTYRKNLVSMQSAKLFAGYVYASAGEGESTTDAVYGGDCLICENGHLLARKKIFSSEMIFSEIDVDALAHDRRRTTTFRTENLDEYRTIYTELEVGETALTRHIDRLPFVPHTAENDCFEEVLSIQANGLKKRLEHTGAKTAVIGISGGLDSTLALLVTARAFDLAGIDRKNIIAVTMPCFGTTSRTYNNATVMSECMGAELREVNIRDAVLRHFKDIGHDENVYDVTFENSQARERTQVLMDIANKNGGLVIGTGDMSELALGWATYNGDHMSMYGVNSGVPKTLIRYLVEYEAQKCENTELKNALEDILDTPVSPELLPPQDGEISQKTEQFVGPYILHDFFMYYILRYGFSPKKIFRLARHAFDGEFGDDEIIKWMKSFYRRFFSQQFKRSCIPDGPKVGSVALSPRGDWRMPSDASARVWLDEIDTIL